MTTKKALKIKKVNEFLNELSDEEFGCMCSSLMKEKDMLEAHTNARNRRLDTNRLYYSKNMFKINDYMKDWHRRHPGYQTYRKKLREEMLTK